MPINRRLCKPQPLDLLTIKERPDIPEEISSYQLVKPIGSGGMGEVYLGQQKAPADRLVAIKLLKPMLNQERLEDECRALAQLNHPNIATLYEVGEWHEGLLFIALEYIEGEGILYWCDAKGYGLHQRLLLFRQLCAGIQYAHARGIVHCDIKPSNVLVTATTGFDTVKVIDFGIAQHQNQSEAASVAAGTLAYMSPEARTPDTATASDVRRDIFALGVLLDKLLGSDVVEEPGSAKLQPLPVDLMHIIERATAHEADDRYPTVKELSADVERFLNHQTITARPQTLWYKTRLFVQRNLTFVLLSVALIVTSLVGYLAQAIQAREAKAQATVAKAARIEAEAAQVEAEALSNFMIELFRTSNPDLPQDDKTTVLQLLDRATEQLMDLDEPSLTDTRFMHTLGSIYNRMDLREPAQTLLEKSIEIKRQTLPANHPEIIESMAQLGVTYRRVNKTEQARIILNEALELQQSGDANPMQEAFIHNHLGNIHWQLLQLEQAIHHHSRAVELRRSAGNEMLLADSLNNLGVIYQLQKQWQQATDLMEQALTLYRKHYGENHPYIGGVINNLAYNKEQSNDFAASEAMLKESWRISEAAYGADHSQTLRAQINLAKYYNRRRDFAAAEVLWISIYEQLEGLGRKSQLAAEYGNGALMLSNKGDYEKAMQWHQASFDVIKGEVISDVRLMPRLHSRKAKSLLRMGDFKAAQKEAQMALDTAEQKLQEGDYIRLYLRNQLADIYKHQDMLGEAKILLKQVLLIQGRNQLIQTQHVKAHLLLGQVASQLQDSEMAIEHFEQAKALNTTIYPEDHISNAEIWYALALELDKENPEAGNQLMRDTLALQLAGLPADHPDLLKTQQYLNASSL